MKRTLVQSVLSVFVLLCGSVDALGQTDVFNSGSRSAGNCEEARTAERHRHNLARAAIEKEKLDVANQLDRDKLQCRGNQACNESAIENFGNRDRQIQIKYLDEGNRHNKANVDIGNGICSGPGPTANATTFPTGLPFTETVLADLSALIIKKLLPDPNNPTPVNSTLVSKLLFLKLTPTMLEWLVNQLNDNTLKLNALRTKARQTAADRAELNRLASYGNTIQKSIRELRLAYDRTKNELGLEAASFPNSGQLNFPY